ncbi:MAG: hypothetical protein ACI8PZ_001815 [Myxococcota bacterium]|jgi:hypothetical protein
MWWALVFGLSVAGAQDRGARSDDAAFVDDGDTPSPPAPRDRLYYTNATFARLNPLGLIDLYRIGWRRRLSTSDSVLLQDTYTFIGPSAMVTPAYSRVGVYGEAQVLAVLRVFADVSAVGYYGTFDQIQSSDDPSIRYSDQTLAGLGDSARAGGGWVATVGGTVRAKAGPVAVRSTGTWTRYDLGLDGDTYFYDQYWDRLAPDGGWMVLVDSDVLVVSGKLRLGARHTFSDTLDGVEGTDGALAHHRVGPLFAWQFSDQAPGAKVNHPTLFAIAQWWAQHPYRTGDEQPAALPLIAVGVSFDGDLAVSGRK